MKSDKININSGIFQGDFLSPLLFCLSLIPLTNEHNNFKYGHEIYEKIINHLLYINELKVFAKNDKKLCGLVSTVKQFSNDICMEFRMDKCANPTFRKTKLTRITAVGLDMEKKTNCKVDQKEIYNYLGIDKGNGTQHNKERVL